MTEIEAVNPATGEILEHLDQQPPESLADTLAEIQARQAEMKRWSGAIEQELRRRLRVLELRFKQFGDYEVRLEGGRESEWDAEGLEAVLKYLVDEGHVNVGDVADVITHPAPVVARAKAKSLRDRLDGGARRAVEACCTWKDKPDKLTVTRSVDLIPQATEEASAAPGAFEPGDRAELPAENAAPSKPPEPPATKLNHEELFK
jgi:hypothetical protein